MATTRSKQEESYEYMDDMLDAMKRIGKERKTKRKQIEEDYDRFKHPMQHKKTAKTNWIKQYESGMLDENYLD